MEENKLDFSSDSFDPLASIYSGEDVKLPDPSAPLLDNVEAFVAKLNKPSNSSGKKSGKKSNLPRLQLVLKDNLPKIKCQFSVLENVLTMF